MKFRNLFFIVFTFVILNLSIFSQDLKVFDLKLGEPFDIRECNYKGMTGKVAEQGIVIFNTTKKVKMYEYEEQIPTTGKCFQRVGERYTFAPNTKDPKRNELPPVQPLTNGRVKLVYADASRPTIAESEDIWIGVQNSILTGVKFYFPNLKQNNVYQTLVKKYGKPSSIEDFYIQNNEGGRKDYYKASWEFNNLQVTFLSLDTTKIGFDPVRPTDWSNGYDSQIGSVAIQYSSVKKSETNPL